MEEKKKKVSGLAKLVGEENAAVLFKQIDDSSEELYTSIIDLTRTFSGTVRAKMIEMVDGIEGLSKEQHDNALDILRTEVLKKLVCGQLHFAGTLQSEIPTAMSDYAAHALMHYEEGIQDNVRHSAAHTLQDLLSSLRGHSPDTAQAAPAAENSPAS